jgi:hypothetical protein
MKTLLRVKQGPVILYSFWEESEALAEISANKLLQPGQFAEIVTNGIITKTIQP